MDGKHILIRPPPNTGSYYYNYKHTFSIVLLAVVDANYKFLYVDVGCNGRVSDGGVFKNSNLSAALEHNTLDIPSPEPLPGEEFKLPYMLVADDAFPLKENIQKPFGQTGLTHDTRIFNYRLSRARRVVENSFGILANRFRVFMTPLSLDPAKVENIVLTCCCLHNFLCSVNQSTYAPRRSFDEEDTETNNISPGEWRQEPQPQGMLPLEKQGSNRTSSNARGVRDYLTMYFNSPRGSVSWQSKIV